MKELHFMQLSGHIRFILTLVAMLLSVGCAATLRGVRPQPPQVPVWQGPTPPAFQWESDQPSTTVTDEIEGKVFGQGTPSGFPVRPGAVIVLAVPDSALGSGSTNASSAPALQRRDIESRFSLISAWLAAGYKVKDAGVLQQVAFNMRRNPARDATTRTTVQTSASGDGKTTVTSTQFRGSNDWWHWNQGLTLRLTDPTSLWGPELVGYSHLGADYFLRVFDYSVSVADRRVTLHRKLGAEDVAALRNAVVLHNAAVQRYNAEARSHNQRVAAYVEEHARYRADTDQWAQQNAHALQGTPGAWPVRFEGIATTRQIAEQPLVSFEQTLARVQASRSVNAKLLTVALMLELLDADKGTVVWAGQLASSAVVDGNQPAVRALTAITRELARQAQK
jgi:hypothetical protein